MLRKNVVACCIYLLILPACIYSKNYLKEAPKKCAWDNCFNWTDDEDVIKVHILSHTHDDMGWIKTVDEYYTGKSGFSPVAVQYILDTVILELLNNPQRKFVYAEVGFLQRYLEDHDSEQLEKLRKLISETGQLELIGGGWVQPDEAASHYVELIDQYTLGLRILNETFGDCGIPKVGWQIDPFGHSREHASLLSQMGFESLYFSRQHYLELERRKQNKSFEFIWDTSDDLGTSIFTGTFTRGTYAAPSMLCFDVLCQDEPVVENPRLQNYNIWKIADTFAQTVKTQVSYFKHKHALLTMGGDFHYTNANTWFVNLERIMKHINANPEHYKMQIAYSTLSCYTKAVRKAIKSDELTIKKADFFPYASDERGHWTGYFTSKPVLKRIIRDSSSLLQLMRLMNVFAKRGNISAAEEAVLERAVGLSIHHDGVTGTSKEFVTMDYQKRMFAGQDSAEAAIEKAFQILANNGNVSPPAQKFCRRLNESICEATTLIDAFVVTLYNSNSHPAESVLVRVPYSASDAIVYDSSGKKIVPSAVSTAFIPSSHFSNGSKYELSFVANVPPLGFASLFVRPSYSSSAEPVLNEVSPDTDTDTDIVTISNDLITLRFDSKTGLLVNFYDKKREKNFSLSQQFFYYESSMFSGAYVFSPADNKVVKVSTSVQFKVVKNGLYEEIRQVVSPYISQVIRLWPGKAWVEFDYIVGPLPKNQTYLEGHEVITRYKLADFKSKGNFQTDANGRQLVKRRRNFAPDYDFNMKDSISGNYYPVNSRILIDDGVDRLTILTDRSQGGSSLQDGAVELMLHRRLFNDDHWGVDENLDEKGEDGRGLIMRGTHRLIIESVYDVNKQKDGPAHRPMAFEIFYGIRASFSPLSDRNIDAKIDEYCRNTKTWYSYISEDETKRSWRSLPPQLNVLTLKWLNFNSLILRLEHIYQKDENSEFSQEITVNLLDIIGDRFQRIDIEELMLAANQPINDSNIITTTIPETYEFPPILSFEDSRFIIETENNEGRQTKSQDWVNKNRQYNKNDSADEKRWNDSQFRSFNKKEKGYFINLKPMQIRTFKVILRPTE